MRFAVRVKRLLAVHEGDGKACRLDLSAASFLNGEGLPRDLILNAAGEVTNDDAGVATRIHLDDVIVFPALVNSHDHLDFSLYPTLGDPPYADVDEWGRDVHGRYASIVSTIEEVSPELRRYWGLLKNLACGVTTLMDHSEASNESCFEIPVRTIRPFRFVHRADTRWAWLQARRTRGDGPLVFHVGEGISEKVRRRSARFLRRLKGRGPLIGVHGISLSANDAQYLDALVWCPVSNFFLFDETADIASLKCTTQILFGTDASISADGSIWDHLRAARQCGGLSDAELLDSVTTTASRAWGLDDTRDFVIARRRHTDPWESLYQVTAADICAVVSQGRLALLSEEFYSDIALDTWHDTYRAIIIGNAAQRVFCPSPAILSRLASIEFSPMSLL